MTLAAPVPSLDADPRRSANCEFRSDPRGLRADEYIHLAEDGYFRGERIELVEGEILRMSPIGNRHVWLISLLNEDLVILLAGRHRVLCQSTLVLDDGTVLEPDFAIVRKPGRDRHIPLPRAADVLLVIEVADSSLAYDLGRKARLYARAGLSEYWVVGVDGRIVVHRDPGADGYRSVAEQPPDARLPLGAESDLVLDFSRVFA